MVYIHVKKHSCIISRTRAIASIGKTKGHRGLYVCGQGVGHRGNGRGLIREQGSPYVMNIMGIETRGRHK
jgi:hypothetical protein